MAVKSWAIRPPFGRPEQRRTLQSGGVHDREDVVGALLKRRYLVELVGEPDASFVECCHPNVNSDVFEKPAEELVLPDDLHIRQERRNRQHVGT